jgi:Uma2 family endonuclease
MYMVSAATRWTAEMVRALPEDRNRYEVIGGDLLVSPGLTWTHQAAVGRLNASLMHYLSGSRVGHVYCAPADIEFSEDTLVQPDIFVVPRRGDKAPRSWEDVRELLLVVEVLSPSSARTDRLQKRDLYLVRGAPEYWVVDVDARLIERWRPEVGEPERLSDYITWQPAGASDAFVVDLAEYFAAVLDD